MKATFLGTGGWYPLYRQTACVAVETSEANFVLDAGTGFCNAKKAINPRKPVYVVLSHFHLDHCIGLFYVPDLFSKNNQVTVIGDKGVRDNIIDRLLAPPFSPASVKWGEYLKFQEIKDELEIGSAILTTALLEHSSRCLGYLLEADDQAVAYCADTAPSAGAADLAQGVDLLIHDATSLTDEEAGRWHSTAQKAAKLALQAKARKLALFHYNPRYDEEKVGALEKDARLYFKNSFAPKDGAVVEV